MTERPMVSSTPAGDDGEAVPATDVDGNQSITTATVATHWYAAQVRMNCEKRFQEDLERCFRENSHFLETWIATENRIRINSRGKRVVREIVILSTFVFVRVEKRYLNDIRFRSDVYRMLTAPGSNVPYVIPDRQLEDVRRMVDSGKAEILTRTIKKGDKVVVLGGQFKDVTAYVQRIQGQKAIIACEIPGILGAAIEINKDMLDFVREGKR